MQEVAIYMVIMVIFILVIIIAGIYLTYKIIQFIVVSVNLYKEMVQNQKRMIELLKKIKSKSRTEITDTKSAVCPSCGTKIKSEDKYCDNCSFKLKK